MCCGNVIVLYHQAQIELLGLWMHQKLIWLLNCWNVHKSKKKLDYIKEKCPNILLVSILTNCTNVLQPANVILQHPFKHASNMESTIK
jgi:hypothetical protein